MRGWFTRHGGVIVAVIGILAWAIIVWRSGMGWNPSGIAWDFDNTAKLGDSFGVLSSIMAALAAYFAFRTYQAARDDIARLERRAAEPSYLNLLERRYDVLDRVRVSWILPKGGGLLQFQEMEALGQKACNRTADRLRSRHENGEITLDEIYHTQTSKVSGLSNLFRFTYHIIAFADRELSQTLPGQPMVKSDPAYQYIRLLRAQLSDSELILIALNCAFGHGHGKFKPLVERYALLHNMIREDIDLFGLRGLFEPSAFGLDEEDRLSSDAPKLGGSDRAIQEDPE